MKAAFDWPFVTLAAVAGITGGLIEGVAYLGPQWLPNEPAQDSEDGGGLKMLRRNGYR